MNDPIPPRTVWTAVGAIPNIPGPVADIIDELVEAGSQLHSLTFESARQAEVFRRILAAVAAAKPPVQTK